MSVSAQEVANHYFTQSFGSAMREPHEGDMRHEANVTIHYYARRGESTKQVVETLANLGIGSAKNLLADYKSFVKNLGQRPEDLY